MFDLSNANVTANVCVQHGRSSRRSNDAIVFDPGVKHFDDVDDLNEASAAGRVPRRVFLTS